MIEVLSKKALEDVMAVLGSVLFYVLAGSSVFATADLKNITAKPGDDVTLTCSAGNISKNVVFEWRRTDLQEDEYVFFYRDNGSYLEAQHESFRNRVFLKDSQMKDGDLSVVLKNVTMNDNGTYECKVLKGSFNSSDSDPSPISSIRLSVDPPGEKGGLIIGIILPVLFLLLLPAVGIWISKKKKGSNQSSRGSNNQQNPEHDRLNSDSNAERNTINTDSAV